MQKAGDSTQELAPTVRVGVALWFPNGFETQGVDWSALEEHLMTVPDLAFETTTAGNFLRQGIHGNLPLGVNALHLAVSCGNPTAPLSLIQRLIDVNPEALHQIEAQHGWNVLHCALKFNRNIKGDEDHNLVDLLLDARPDLVYDGATSIDDYGLPPLAYVKCPKLVPKLVKLMPPKLVGSLLKKIFLSRKLFGGSVQATEQIVHELSNLEIQQNRSLLATSILPEPMARKHSLIKYVLIQTSKCGRHSQERSDLTCLIDPIIQASYRFHMHQNGDLSNHNYYNNNDDNNPPPLECLKYLLSQQRVGQKVLGLYSSVMSNAEYTENLEYMEPDLKPMLTALPTLTFDNNNNNNNEAIENDDAVKSNSEIAKLLQCKGELDEKIEQSLEALRLAAASLENYKAMYSSTVDRLCREMASQSTTKTSPVSNGDAEEHVKAIVPFSSYSSTMPPTPPKRQKSGVEDEDDDDDKTEREKVAANIMDTIENIKGAGVAVDKYSQRITTESESLVRQQEDLEIVDLSYFRGPDHDQVVDAMESIANHQREKASLQKCLEEVQGQLNSKETESSTCSLELNLRWATLNGEIREVSRKIENCRELVTNRRKDLGGRMIKARRLLKTNSGPANKVVRTKASKFLRLAKQGMKELMATIVATSPNYKPVRRQRKKKWRHQQQQQQQLLEQQQQKILEEDEELNRMTKRMRL